MRNNENEAATRSEFAWAIKIVRKHFSAGLDDICDARFLSQRYRELERKHDPIYFGLLKGMERRLHAGPSSTSRPRWPKR